MRRVLAFTLTAAMLVLAGWLLLEAAKPDPMPLGSVLPDLEIRTLEGVGTVFPIGEGSRLVVMVYHTTCPACLEELRMLERDAERFATLDLTLALVTDEDPEVVDLLRADWPTLASSPRVQWVISDEAALKEAFPLPGTPGIYVFGRQGTLLRKVLGQRTLDALVAGLNKIGAPEASTRGITG